MNRCGIVAWLRSWESRSTGNGPPVCQDPRRARLSAVAAAVVAGLSIAAGPGCVASAPESVVLKERTGLEVSTSRLRMQVRSLAKPFSGIVESAADTILAHATTPEERIAGLRIKVDGVPAVQGALFEPDPVAATFETAALLVQTRESIEKGPGATLPPLVKAEVLGAIDSMRARVRLVGEQIGATPEGRERFWATAEGWAREHPITTNFTSRETTQALFAEYMARESKGLRAMAGRAEETMVDMTLRFDLYGEYIAKQVRWQGELLLEELLQRDFPRRAIDSVGTIPISVDALPFDVDTQRELVTAAIRSERALILGWARAERLETLEWAQLERQAITGVVGQERQLVIEALRAEREAVLASLREERIATMQDLDKLVSRAVESSGEKLVDHATTRVAQLLAVVLPAIFLAAWFLIWYARRPR
jgi:hypothetical protein